MSFNRLQLRSGNHPPEEDDMDSSQFRLAKTHQDSARPSSGLPFPLALGRAAQVLEMHSKLVSEVIGRVAMLIHAQTKFDLL
jgi:hypothetical protein